MVSQTKLVPGQPLRQRCARQIGTRLSRHRAAPTRGHAVPSAPRGEQAAMTPRRAERVRTVHPASAADARLGLVRETVAGVLITIDAPDIPAHRHALRGFVTMSILSERHSPGPTCGSATRSQPTIPRSLLGAPCHDI